MDDRVMVRLQPTGSREEREYINEGFIVTKKMNFNGQDFSVLKKRRDGQSMRPRYDRRWHVQQEIWLQEEKRKHVSDQQHFEDELFEIN